MYFIILEKQAHHPIIQSSIHGIQYPAGPEGAPIKYILTIIITTDIIQGRVTTSSTSLLPHCSLAPAGGLAQLICALPWVSCYARNWKEIVALWCVQSARGPVLGGLWFGLLSSQYTRSRLYGHRIYGRFGDMVNFWVVPISLSTIKLTIYPEFDLNFGYMVNF